MMVGQYWDLLTASAEFIHTGTSVIPNDRGAKHWAKYYNLNSTALQSTALSSRVVGH